MRQDSCWALSYLTDGFKKNIKLAHENDLVPLMLNFIEIEDELTVLALHVLGNFARVDKLADVIYIF